MGEATGREQHSFPGLDEDRCPVPRRADADHPTVFDNQVVHRRVRPQRRGAGEVDEDLQHLAHERRPVGEQLLTPQPADVRAKEHTAAVVNDCGDRLKYCTERISFVFTVSP